MRRSRTDPCEYVSQRTKLKAGDLISWHPEDGYSDYWCVLIAKTGSKTLLFLGPKGEIATGRLVTDPDSRQRTVKRI